MRKKGRSFFRLSSLAMLIVLICFSVNTCKKPEPELIPIGAVKVVKKLDNGNFEVTPALIELIHELAYKVKKLELELEKCREKK